MRHVERPRWEDAPEVSLLTEDRASALADAVDPSAAYVITADQARAWKVVPMRWELGSFHVAASRGLSDEAWQVLDGLGPIQVHQASLVDIQLAQWELYGVEGHGLFGQLVSHNFGVNADVIQDALAIQRERGGRIGECLVGMGILTSWQVTQILGKQTGIPVVNLLAESSAPTESPTLDSVWALLDEKTWRTFSMVPIDADEHTIVVAVTNPFDCSGRTALSVRSAKRIKTVLTGPRDIQCRLDEKFREHHLHMSQTRLMETHPDASATRTVTPGQARVFVGIGLAFVALAVWHVTVTLAAVSSFLVVAYSALVGHRLWIIRQGTREDTSVRFSEAELKAMRDEDLPIYTILIPARDEAAVLPMLTQALQQLDYPKNRLDVKLLLEADDVATIEAAREAHLPSYIEIVVVPVAEPRTKPKACNYGLQIARGEFVTIYDAEDLPDPQQLKKALLAFSQGDERLACVQAKLSYFNADQNLLTRWFTAEYAAWFDLLLPALHAARMPIPLGGTSNHFRTQVLQDLGAWDPFNVTEDADLGIRLHRAGYRTAVMDSVTYEEANSEFVNWVRQRSRWIKGYLQTWLVHMRHPLQLRRQLGRRGFWGFQLAILGTPLMFILNPIYWFVTSLWFMTHWGLIPNLFPPGIYYLGMLNLLVGNFAFTYLNAVGAAQRGAWSLVPYALLTPVYWAMMSLASWKALLQLLTRPSHWEKTDHGLVDWDRVQEDVPGIDSRVSA